MPGFQVDQRRLHVLARPEAVDPEIDAITGALPIAQAPDLDVVGDAARGADLEAREDGVRRIGVPYPERLGAGPQPPPVDLVGVCRAPVVNGRELDLRSPG